PVDVAVPYDPASVPAGTDPARIAVAYFNGTAWSVAGGTADPATRTVRVRLQAFHGEVLTTILVATAVGLLINRAIKWGYGAEGVSSDPISDKNAATWITPEDPAVTAAATSGTVGGVPLGDARRLAAYLEGNGTNAKPVTLVGQDGTSTTLQGRWSKAPGSNWQKPGDYLTKGNMAGDCTDVTSALVSVFRSLGYPAKAVFGYAVDKDSPHVWGEVRIGGKPYLIDEEGQLQPLDLAVKSLHLIRPEKDDPRAFMWDENGQAAYDPSWWTAGYDINGTWTGTFTITDLSIDEEAAKQAADAGCTAAVLDAMKGKVLPLTLTFTVDIAGRGTAKMFIDTSSIKDSNGKPVTSEPQTLPITYAKNRVKFEIEQSEAATSTMSGEVVAGADGVVLKGTTTVSGPGFSATGVWSASPK
ncbi:MAG: transglutaminase domain-containing protein, partial [Acidimicrobiales bacterium]